MEQYIVSSKSLFVVMVVMMFSAIASAQNPTSQHLTFKGVPITGTLIDYTLKMKENGFTHLATKDGTAILKGDFAGYKNCTVGVSTLKQKDLVHQIAVVFPDRETWSTLYSNYSSLKELLTEKYGEPTTVFEKFGDEDGDDKDDNNKMYEVKFDRCKYYSVWRTDRGDIEVSIEHNSVTSCFVKLAYFDKVNGAIIRAKAKDDL